MFCNCRFRKPVMLMSIIGMITFVNYTLISWIMSGSTAKDAGPMAQVIIVPMEKDHPVFAQNRGLDDTLERSGETGARSNMRIKSVRKTTSETFFDKDTIEAINQELDEEPLMPPPEAMNFEVPPGFQESEQQRIVQEQEISKDDMTKDDIDGFARIQSDNERIKTRLGEDTVTTNERIKTLLREESGVAAKTAKRPNVLNVLNGSPNDALKRVKALYEAKDANLNLLDETKGDWSDDDFDSDRLPTGLKPSDLSVNITGKIEIDLPDRSFTGSAFPQGQKLIKDMMKHAWEGYKAYAWGEDDLQPWRKKGKNCLGAQPLGLTITDSLDTLHIMGMEKEYEEGAEWVFSHLDFDKNDNVVSLFETNIRLLGGFLANHALTKDQRFLDKAKDLGDRFMKNFEGKNVFPSNRLKLNGKTGAYGGSLYGQSYMSVSLAQIGTFSVEFGYLSHVTGNPIYREKALAIIESLSRMNTTIPGLYPQMITAGTQDQHFESIPYSPFSFSCF